MATLLEARALSLAFEWGWIDRLAAAPVPLADLGASAGLPDRASQLICSLLVSGGVLKAGDPVSMADGFHEVMQWRDLLEAKLWFVQNASADIDRLFEPLLRDQPTFMEQSNTFALFRYDRCFDPTQDNMALARRWVSYTTTLTRYEASACWERINLADVRHMIDIGGNSGEFARQACTRSAELRATVFDLPVVCGLGREHLAGTLERDRVNFVAGDLRRDDIPGEPDLVTFKSVLHDWPEQYAAEFLAKSVQALAPGGRTLIFERAPIPTDGTRLSYASAANLVFLPFFREAGFYLDVLERLGMLSLRHETVELEIPFHLITAVKP